MIRAMDSAGPIRTETHAGHLSALRRHFEISLYFLLLTGVLTLVSTGKLDLVSILLLPAALLVKGYRWWHGKGPEISNRVANWLTIAYFVFFPVDLWIVSRILAKGSAESRTVRCFARDHSPDVVRHHRAALQRDDNPGLSVSDHDGLHVHAGLGHP